MITAALKEREIDIATAAVRMELLTDEGDNVFLWGKPGIGKTDIVRQLGKKKSRKVIEFHANLREPVDLRGIPVPDLKTGTTRWLTPDELPQVDRDGEEGYLFCDEANTASPQMQAALFSLFLEGRIGEYWLPRGWRAIGAGNRMIDRAAAQRMPTALRNRLAHLFIAPDIDAWVAWAIKNGVAAEMIAFVKFRPELLHRMPAGDENAFPTPRSITRAAKYVRAPAEHRMALFAAHIGDDVAGEADGFIRLYESIGSLDAIIANPDNADIPTAADIRYAVSVGLARMSTRKNFGAVIRYADRLPRESKMLLIHEATERDKLLKDTAAYSKWAVDNGDLILQS
jgi:MoxR-like ATPase